MSKRTPKPKRGRPRGRRYPKAISVQVTPEWIETATEGARRMNLSRAEFVRQAVESYAIAVENV